MVGGHRALCQSMLDEKIEGCKRKWQKVRCWRALSGKTLLGCAWNGPSEM